MRVIVMGCGRVGAKLSERLDASGHQVTVIDTYARAFKRLPAGFGGDTVLGTGIDEDVLIKAGIRQADVFVATTQGDNRNAMAAQIAQKLFDVPLVIARLYDVGRAETYEKLGVRTYCPTLVATSILEEMIEGKHQAGQPG